MKVILSRKGFDSTSGGYPSPIIDGMPLSLPIPDKTDQTKYSESRYKNGLSYLDVIKQLGIKRYDENSTCHYDPDLKLGAIGQIKQAQKHLENKGVGIGDLFLFFGWFKETTNIEGRIVFKNNTKYPEGFHLIFGYLEIDDIIHTSNQDTPLWLRNHCHYTRESVRMDKSNTIYVGKRKSLLRQNQAGFGILPFSEKRILTKEGRPRSHWDINKLKELKSLSISYHAKESWGNNYFQSAGRGQEFVIEESRQAENWALGILTEDSA